MNSIAPISFGRIIKVSAPNNIVKSICGIANDAFSSREYDTTPNDTKSDIKRIFEDSGKMPIKQFGSYLLSGEDAKTAELYYIIAKNDYEYEKSMNSLVNYNPGIKIMTVAHNGERVKAVDLIA